MKNRIVYMTIGLELLPGASSDMGSPPQICQECRDFVNPACNDGVCGACQSSDDCSAPRLCAQGRCITVIN